jgi:Leucine-rich repeat (LRR) protein
MAEAADGPELDLTNAHLANLADVDLPEDLMVRPDLPPPSSCRRSAACRLAPAHKRASTAFAGLAWPGLLQILDLTANRLRSLEPNLLALTGLRRLCLRQNLLSEGAEVEALASAPGGAAVAARLVA